MIGLVVMVALCVGFVGLVVYDTGGRPNRWPGRAGGDLQGRAGMGDGMAWWRSRWPDPTDLIVPSVDEAMGEHYDLPSVDAKLRRLKAQRRRAGRDAGGWMDEAGAFKRAGLVEDGLADGPRAPSGNVSQ